MIRRARIIYNPISGREKLKPKLASIIEMISNKGFVVEVYPTKCEGDAVKIAKQSCNEKLDWLVVCGGDGTLHEVINGIATESYRPTICYFPAGTTNDFANSIGIPTNIDNAIKLLDDGEAKRIDIGQIGDDYFVYVAAFGVFTNVTYTTSSKLKTVFGQLAYIFSGLAEISKLNKTIDVKINLDGKSYEEEASIICVINSTNVGGIRNLIPNARINDGKFDVLIINSKNAAILPEVLRSLAVGVRNNIDKNGLIHFETDKLEVLSDTNIEWNFDGEFGAYGSKTITCLKEHIEIIVPKNTSIIK